MNDNLAIGTAPVSAIVAEATSLRELFVQQCPALGRELCPQHRATKRPVELEPDAPERMRRLWDVLGNSHATAKVRVLSREESRAALERIFAEWFAGSQSRTAWAAEGGPEAYFAALPARYRLLSQRRDEIALTDETGDPDDPPVLVMRRTEPPVVTEYRSYVEWLIWELLTTVTWSRNATFNLVSGIRGERILPSLYPQIERLGEGLYWMKTPRAETMPPYTAHIFYPKLDNYFRWVLELPDELIRFAQRPRARLVFVPPRGDWNVWKTAPEGFRRFRYTDLVGKVYDTEWHAVGQVDGLYLWLHMHSEYDLFVSFDPGKEDEVRAILAAHDLKVRGVIDDLKGYDEYGW